MAKVVGPLFSVLASGKMGSLIYANNRNGPYTRAYAPGTQPGSTEQIKWKAALAAVVDVWTGQSGSMTQDEREGWMRLAARSTIRQRLVGVKRRTGYNTFIQLNVWRSYAALTILTEPPYSLGPEYFTAVTLEQDVSGDLEMSLDPDPSGSEMFYCSRVLNQSLGRNFRPNTQKIATFHTGSAASPYTVATNAELDLTTKRHFFAWRTIDSKGRSSSLREVYLDAAQI